MTSIHAAASRPGFIWLDSADPSSPASQRSIVASDPIATWVSSGESGCSTGVIQTHTLATFLESGEKIGTIMGYFSYESAQTFNLPEFKNVSFHHHDTVPDIWLGIYPTVTVLPPFNVDPADSFELISGDQPAHHDWFIKQIHQIKTHIQSGDIYQANLTRPFQCKFSGNPFDLYCQFRQHNPAPYGAYLNTGSAQIMCTSPEQFFKIKRNTIQSRPIKGTMSRTKVDDSATRDALLQSEKNRAELTMIIDLIRNDLGKICEVGSISVPEPATIETYKQLHHLVATIQGTLKPNTPFITILRALLPGGSITGAPKAKAMEIIGQVESSPRSVYTGAIGYHNLQGETEFNISIRTAYHVDGTVTYHAGCGIVADSDPETEWVESETKSLGFYDCLTNQYSTTLK